MEVNDLISRQAAINAISEWGLIDGLSEGQAIEILGDEEKVPSVQPNLQQTCNQLATDCISRQAAADAVQGIGRLATLPDNDAVIRMSAVEYVLFNLPSAQPEPQWIPCSERLPEDLEEVNVTWVNHEPEPYYDFVKGKPFTASAVYYKGKWFWYTSTCADLLAEYGKNPNHEIDDAIEITAWMPLPEPYKERREE